MHAYSYVHNSRPEARNVSTPAFVPPADRCLTVSRVRVGRVDGSARMDASQRWCRGGGNMECLRRRGGVALRPRTCRA